MEEIFVSFQSDEVKIGGTLTLPKTSVEDEQVPAILLLHGSGPVDRDENMKRFKMNVFKLLSDFFVANGFAVLRYDKRGIGSSEGNYYEAGLWDLVADGKAALTFLQNHPAIDANRICLLGHSEGSMLAPAIYEQNVVQGIIFVAGAMESLKQTSLRQAKEGARAVEQTRGLKGKLLRLFNVQKKLEKQQTDVIERIERTSKSVIRVKGLKVPAKWMREHFAYNVENKLAEITCPVLAITGSKDIQVPPKHAQLFAEKVSGEGEYYIVENMNHLLRNQAEQANLLTLKKVYNKSIKKPLNSHCLQLMKTWLNKNI